MKTRAELEENQMKQYNWEQDQIKHMKVHTNHFYMYFSKQEIILLRNIVPCLFVTKVLFIIISFRSTLLDLAMVVQNLHDRPKVKKRFLLKWLLEA